MLAGHSYGDYVALCAAGSLGAEELFRLSHERGRIILEATDRMPGAMAAIDADADTVAAALAGMDGVTAANLNSPHQTVISGTEEGIQAALECFTKLGIRGQRIPVACAFHSPLVAPASEPFARAYWLAISKLLNVPFMPTRPPSRIPTSRRPLVEVLARHLVSPVRFRDEIESMYAAGARIFIEVGPQGVLTGLVSQTLGGRPHLAIASDLKSRPGLVQLQHLLGQLLVEGVPVQIARLHDGRDLRRLDLNDLERDSAPAKLSPNTWLVNSVRVRPLHGPEPKLLGQAQPDTAEPVLAPVPTILDKPKASPPSTMKPTNTHPPLSASSTNGAAHSNGVHHPPVPAPLAASVAAASSDEAAQVMLRYQELMTRFLDTQRSVMLSYLQGAAPSVNVASSLPPATHLATNENGSNGHATNGYVLPSPLPTVAVAAQPPSPPAVAKPVAVAAPTAPACTAVDRETVTTRLLDIVCKRTGYPTEMLGLDLDLEADLGIDSIKRVEILGLLAEANGGQSPNVAMEKLTNIKTLRGIIDCLAACNSDDKAGASATKDQNPSLPLRSGIQRMLVAVTDAPALSDAVPALPGGTILLTDDGAGVAANLAQRLRDLGQQVALVSAVTATEGFYADLTNPSAVEDLLVRIHKQCGPINGLIHLLPLAPLQAGQSWADRLLVDVKALFLLARGMADELQRRRGQRRRAAACRHVDGRRIRE